MVRVTNNVKEFIEQEIGDIYIYGAGNAGYWVGDYMGKCGYSYSSYIDRNVVREDATYLGHPVLPPSILETNKSTDIRIIITPKEYETILADIMWIDHKFGGRNICCLIPRYENIISHREEYHINRMLSYFRRKLLRTELPTIISNTCIAGNIYSLFDYIMLSPTINTGIDSEDFIKLCENFRHYLQQDIKEIKWERAFGNPSRAEVFPVGILEDIKIEFAHISGEDGLVQRWNMMCKKANLDNILFIMTGMNPPVSVMKRFLSLKEKHLFINFNSSYGCDGVNGIYFPRNYFEDSASAVENYFDIVGWMNNLR